MNKNGGRERGGGNKIKLKMHAGFLEKGPNKHMSGRKGDEERPGQRVSTRPPPLLKFGAEVRSCI